jgi:fatty-acid desaturase
MSIYIALAHVGNRIKPMATFCIHANFYAAALIGLFTIPNCHPFTLAWAFILWPISGNGITGGVHRLWAHRSYKVVVMQI